jgi:hypothetical protein
MSTAAITRLEERLVWYRNLRPDERSQLGLVAQRGISAFVEWYERPATTAWTVAEIFAHAPSELTRAISLQQALQLTRVVVDSVEAYTPRLTDEHNTAGLREAVLRYSREVAFGVADVYARAAESRGAWDTRLEALVVDAILRGENSDALRSRIAAVGFAPASPLTVVVGNAPATPDTHAMQAIRRRVAALTTDSLVGLQGDRLVLILAGMPDRERALTSIADCFGDGPVVYGPEASTLNLASDSARSAFAGAAAAGAWSAAPRPVSSESLWPERLLNGDPAARRALLEQVFAPLSGSVGLVDTLAAFVEGGHSLEGTARALFVHANTVRYRLKRIAEITGWDPLVPREAFVLHTALIAGRLAHAPTTDL